MSQFFSISLIDNICCLTQITEKRIERGGETHLLFVNLSKAYDTIPVKQMWKILEATHINVTVITALKQLYQYIVSNIKNGNRLSSGVKVTKGPVLFNIYIDGASKKMKD